jgi:excisionase family DNA binding protein
MLTTSELASVLGVTPATIREWILQGWLRAKKQHGRYLISDSEVIRALLEGRIYAKKRKDDSGGLRG